jgi:hypothetical protein
MIGLVLLLLAGALILAGRQSVLARARWRFLRLRLRPGAGVPPALERTLMRVLAVQGGEVWQVAEETSWALVVSVPAVQVAPLREALRAHTPEIYVSTVTVLPWPAPARLVLRPSATRRPILVGRVVGRGGVVGQVVLDDTRGLPLPAPWLMTLVRALAPWTRRTRGPLLPADLATTPGCRVPAPPAIAPMLPPMGSLPIGVTTGGERVTLPCAAGQAVAIVGGGERASSALTTLLTQSLAAGIALVATLPRSVADAWLPTIDIGLTGRVRVVDARALGDTATLDVVQLLDDVVLAALIQDLAGLTAADPALRSLAPTIAAWRATGERHLGTLLADLMEPDPALGAQLGWDGAERRGYGQRWLGRLVRHLAGPLLALTASPGEDLPALLGAGGGLVVIAPDDAYAAGALHTMLTHLVRALPASPRPLLLATDHPTLPPLRAPQAMAFWTTPAAPTVPAWHLLVGGTQASGSPYARLDVQGATVATLSGRWLLLHPRATYQAWCVPLGQVLPADERGLPVVGLPPHAGPIPFLPDDTPTVPALWDAAVQTLLAAWRRATVMHETLGTLVAVQPTATIVIDRTGEERVQLDVRVHQARRELATALHDTSVGAIEVGGRTDGGAGLTTLTLTLAPLHSGRSLTPTVGVTDTVGAYHQYPWSALCHLLITNDAAGDLAFAAALQTLATSSPDRVALTVVGDALPTWQPLLATPHALPARTADLADALDALLAAQLDPHGDARTPLVLLRLVDTPTIGEQRALMRAMQRSQERPFMLILSAKASWADLVPFDRYCSRLDGGSHQLTVLHDRPRTIDRLTWHGTTAVLATLPARTQAAERRAPRPPTAVWEVPLDALAPLPSSLWTPAPAPSPAPAHPGHAPAAPIVLAPQAMRPAVAALASPAQDASSASGPLAIAPSARPVLTLASLRPVIAAILPARRRGLTPRVLADAFPQTSPKDWTWADVATVGTLLPGVLIPPPGGEGSWRLAAELIDDAAVWAAVDAALDTTEDVLDEALV